MLLFGFDYVHGRNPAHRYVVPNIPDTVTPNVCVFVEICTRNPSVSEGSHLVILECFKWTLSVKIAGKTKHKLVPYPVGRISIVSVTLKTENAISLCFAGIAGHYLKSFFQLNYLTILTRQCMGLLMRICICGICVFLYHSDSITSFCSWVVFNDELINVVSS